MITDCDINLDLSMFNFVDITADAFIGIEECFKNRITWRGQEGILIMDVINYVQDLPGFSEFFMKKVPATVKYPNASPGFCEFQLYAKFTTSDFAMMAKLAL